MSHVTTADHDLSTVDAPVRAEAFARAALRHYAVPPDVTLELLNISENATFLVTAPDGGRSVLRVHRRGYHTAAQIGSELAWLDALRADAGVRTPRILPSLAGSRLLEAVDEHDGAPRHAVLFEWLPGAEPPDHDLAGSFEAIGGLPARMRERARAWRRPPGFDRFAWDYDGAFGRTARWGRWQDGIAVGPAERAVLGRLDDTLRTRLRAYGKGPERYGLVHADLRLANLLAHGGETYVIDFDDCGWSWLLYDLGAALSFIEDDPRVPELVEAWLTGYRRISTLPKRDEAEIPTFILMRRLLLVAWIGSHAGTALARSMGARYTEASCVLAEDYLTRS